MKKPAGPPSSQEFLERILPGNGAAMRTIREHVQRINDRPNEVSRILLLGDPGVGKSHIAQAICMHHCWLTNRFTHSMESPVTPEEIDNQKRFYIDSSGKDILEQSGDPFAEVLVPTLEGEIGLSELFGHEKGAFTGATKPKKGFFGQSRLTHVFLDEIGYASTQLQQRLLQICATGRFHPIGSDITERTSARIIFATNVDLREAVLRNRFQPDLYWRMLNYVIALPPLAQRRDEIAGIVERRLDQLKFDFLKDVARVNPLKLSSEDLLWAVEDYEWPGNLRELIHCIDRWFLFRDATSQKVERSFRDVALELRTYLPGATAQPLFAVQHDSLTALFEARLLNAVETGTALGTPKQEVARFSQDIEFAVSAAFLNAVKRCQDRIPGLVGKAFGEASGTAHNQISSMKKIIKIS